MLMKSCRCGKQIPYGMKRCPECEKTYQQHKAQLEKESKRRRDRRYNAKRDPQVTKFYHSKEWQMLSAKRMQMDGFKCRHCGKAVGARRMDGTVVRLEVDHIEEISTPEGWAKRYDIDNLRTLCTQCHNERHHRFQKRRQTGVG